MGEKTSVAIINLRWACGCLAACLIGTLSFRWAQSPQIVNIISVALSLASLVLAVIAIMQALVSNDGMIRSLSDISNAASNILSVSKDLSSATYIFSSHVDRIGSMPNQLNAINDQVNEIRNRMDTNRSVDAKISPTREENSPIISDDYSPTKLTYGIALTIYMLLLSYRTGKKFKCSDIISNQNVSEYCNGVAAGIRLSEISDIDFDELNNYSAKSLGKLGESEIENIVFRAMRDEDAPQGLGEYVKSIDNYFKEPPPTSIPN